MRNGIETLHGSKKRDDFRWAHKNKMVAGGNFYGSDLDFSLISYEPRGVICYIDYKDLNDNITNTERILYDTLITTAPVYIVESGNPLIGPFRISQYESTEIYPLYLKFLRNWAEWEQWERKLRQEYKQRLGETQII